VSVVVGNPAVCYRVENRLQVPGVHGRDLVLGHELLHGRLCMPVLWVVESVWAGRALRNPRVGRQRLAAPCTPARLITTHPSRLCAHLCLLCFAACALVL
jgi:hypothetical protein